MNEETELKTYVAELHVHTVVSPCAAVEMIPPLIVREALNRGINLIAITDHNSGANVEAVQKAANGSGLEVLPGMELQTSEEVHLLCIFDTLAQLETWQEQVDDRLPPRENDIEHFGEQFVVDENGEFLRRESRLLSTSAKISLEEAVGAVLALGGLTIPAHVNRRAFSLIGNLGFVPPDLSVDALEISRHIDPTQARERLHLGSSLTLLQSGDVHRLDEFLGVTIFKLAAPTVVELKRAFRNERGRSVFIRPPTS